VDGGEPAGYRIVVQGVLDDSWEDWFGGLRPLPAEDGPGTCTLVGVITDQAELHGILARLRDLNLPLLSVTRLGGAGPAGG
jgi:hypothetical protein